MLIFDQLKKNDPQLRAMAIAIFAGLCPVGGGALVGADCIGVGLPGQPGDTIVADGTNAGCARKESWIERRMLAENRPGANNNVSLYLDDLRKQFDARASTEIARKGKEFEGATRGKGEDPPTALSIPGFHPGGPAEQG